MCETCEMCETCKTCEKMVSWLVERNTAPHSRTVQLNYVAEEIKVRTTYGRKYVHTVTVHYKKKLKIKIKK